MKGEKTKENDEFDPLKWLSKKLETLRIDKFIKDIEKNFSKDDLYGAHLWTPLKLIALMWWLTVYSRIVPRYFPEYWYIDLLASSGANVIKETGDVILGSPLLSHLIPYNPFKHHVYIEIDPEKANVLDKMLNHFRFSNYTIFQGDCNDRVYSIPFNKINHYFCFIDCEGLDIKWSTLEHLLRHRGDILFVFQTSGVNRVFGKGTKRGYSPTLDEFCGGNWWQSCDSIEELLRQYMIRIKQKADKLRRFRNFVDYVRVKGKGGSFVYEVILICRYGDYVRAWLDLKNRLANLEDKDVDMALKICKGEIVPLTEFFKRHKSKKRFKPLDEFF